jgi:hypothetical protein
VIYGGIHATLYPDEARDLGAAHAVVTGDGDHVWPEVLRDALSSTLRPMYAGGRVDGSEFMPARWNLLPEGRYMWASVQTVRGCPKHCSFLLRLANGRAAGRDSGRTSRWCRKSWSCRRRGFRFIALADDNFYPVTLEDLRMAARRGDKTQLRRLEQLAATVSR